MLDQLDQETHDDVDRMPAGRPAVWMPYLELAALWSGKLWTHRYPVLIALALSTFAWFYGPSMLYGQRVSADSVIRAEFIQTVVASGHVEAPFRVNIASQITGVVTDVPVAEGQSVKAGDTLVVLDDREARAAVVQNEGLVAQAEARLRQIKELTLPAAEQSLQQAHATLVNTQQTYDRAQKLASTGYGTRAALDDATKALDIAKAQVRSAEFQVYTNRPGGSDYVMAETQLAQAKANLASAQSRLTYTVLKAPRDGILITRVVERGNVVQPNNVLMKLSPTGDTQIIVLIDEKNFGSIHVGQKALVSADAFPQEIFPAEVVYVNPGIDLQTATVEVKLDVTSPPAYLQQDMTVSVDIETARHRDALIIPATAIRKDGSGKTSVMTVINGRARVTPVTLGLVSAGKAEILNGLSEGTPVLPAISTIREGAKVKATFQVPRKTS